jgi:hypothetical protein
MNDDCAICGCDSVLLLSLDVDVVQDIEKVISDKTPGCRSGECAGLAVLKR